jgi:hypothetical protein
MRFRGLVLSVLGLTLGVLAFAGSPALALRLHVYGSSFGSEGSGPGQFKQPVGVAVSEVGGAAREVYVVDRANNRVQIFNSTGTTVLGEFNGAGAPTGTFENPEWIAVDNSTNPLDPSAGDVYVTDTGHNVVDKFGPTGTYEGQIATGAEGVALSEIHGVAVDPSGLVWIYQSRGQVDDYSDALANAFLASRSSTRGFWEPGFAVDSKDNMFLNWGGTIAKFDSSGREIIEEFENTEHSSGVAVDPSTDYVYIDHLSSIAVFNTIPGCTPEPKCRIAPPGALVERFGEGQISENEPQLSEGSGVAVSASSGTVYVADRSADAIRVFPAIFIPDPVTGQATNVHNEGSATLNGTVNPQGEPVTSCRFEYGTSKFYGESVPCEQSSSEIGTGTTPVHVSANLTGLTPSTRYHYRLVVADASGENHGEDTTFTLLAPPTVEGESSPNVGSTVATVGARIGPGGSPTAYRVEYGTSPQYGSSTPEVSVGASLETGSVQAEITDLQPGTPYHFRFVTENTLGTTQGTDATFTTTRAAVGATLTLPDQRSYELVSSVSENQNMYYPVIGRTASEAERAFQTLRPFRAATDGNSVTYPGDPSVEAGNGSTGSGNGNQYLAIRGRSGWSATDISPTTGRSTQYEYFSSELSAEVFRSINAETVVSASPSGPAGCPGIYSGVGGESGYHALFTTGEIPGTCPGMSSAGGSADGSHLLFEAGGMLTEEAQYTHPSGAGNLYDRVGGQLRLINVLPDGQPEPTPTASYGGPRFGHEAFPDLSNVSSTDGSRIFWSSIEAPKIEEPLTPKALYVRENDTEPQSPIGPDGKCTVPGDACTVQIDAGESGCVSKGNCGSGGGQFWTASSDGSRAFFTDCGRLTADSTAVSNSGCVSEETGSAPAHLTGNDLYEYDVETGRLTDLTVNHNAGSPLGADVQGVIGASEDGSYVYFVASGVLASGAIPRICLRSGGDSPEEERERHEEENGLLPAHHGCNLYVRHDGATTFIGALLYADNELPPLLGAGSAPRGDWRANLGERTAKVGSDGHALVFTSTRSLTSYRSFGLREAFVYEALTGRIVCASCDPSGAPPSGSVEFHNSELGGYLPTSNQATFSERFVSNDGGRVFFETSQALVPQDTNGLQDVYEWERNGLGSCAPINAGAAEPGCIYLLSGGDGSEQTYIVDSDATGENVFIMTRDQLLPRVNENIVVYDVRVNGGFPETSLACTGTGCQGVPPAPPIFATPSSATFNGVGNFTPHSASTVKPKSRAKRCRRGSVKKHTKCVKQRTRRKAKRASTRSRRGGKR